MEYKDQINILRELAKQVKEISETPDNAEKRQKWADHNDLKGNTEPLIWICPDDDGGWLELIPEEHILCRDEKLRQLERQLRKYIYHYDHFKDDFVFEPSVRFDIPGEYTGYTYGAKYQKSAWGIDIVSHPISKNAYHLDNYLDDEKNVEALLNHKVDFIVDDAEYSSVKELYENAIGDILRVDFTIPYIVLVQSLLIELVHLSGLEELFYSLYECPDKIKQIISHMANSKNELLDSLQKRKLLFDNNTNIYTGSGGLGYTNTPVADKNNIQLSDMWGFADSQEFSSVSPRMFKEFALDFQKIGLNRFGRACYGCCEPLDTRYSMIIEALPNLRRVSVSPWSDVDIAAEFLKDRAIYSWKPNPAAICTGFDEEEIAKKLKYVARATQNCTTEIILKDIRTCGDTPVHLMKFADMVNEIFK